MDEWPQVARVAHCEGGIVVVNNPGPEVSMEPTPNGELLKYSIGRFPNFIASIRNQGIQVLGCEFITKVEQIDGGHEPRWRPVYDPIDDLRWPFFDVQQKWSQIANTSAKKNEMSSYINAAHISAQLRICGWRILDLSERYERHLSSLVRTKEFRAGGRLSGRFSEQMHVSAHAIVAELSALRDYLAIFVIRNVFRINKSSLDSMPKLLIHLEKTVIDSPIVPLLFQAKSWLDLFAEYRNLLTHNAPLSEVDGARFTLQVEHQTTIGKLAKVQLFLPNNPKEIRERFRSANSFKTFRDWALVMVSDKNRGPDVLNYCHALLGNFVALANKIADHSGIKPEMFTFDSTNSRNVTIKVRPKI